MGCAGPDLAEPSTDLRRERAGPAQLGVPRARRGKRSNDRGVQTGPLIRRSTAPLRRFRRDAAMAAQRGREKAGSPESSPRGGGDAGGRPEAEEETMGCSRVSSGAGELDGVHGDDGGVFLGSEMKQLARAPRGRKEERGEVAGIHRVHEAKNGEER